MNGDNLPPGPMDMGMDVEAAMNARGWLEAAILKAGAEVTDKGLGLGQADLGILLDGMPFDLSIKPREVPAA